MTDTTLASIENEVAPIIAKSKEIAQVKDADSESRAVEFLKQISLRLKSIKEARVSMLKPLKDHVKTLEGQFNAVSDPLEQADEAVRAGMVAYRNSVLFKEAEAKRKDIEEQARVAARNGDIDELNTLSKAHSEASEVAPRKVETQSGEARFRKTWRFEIVDLEKLPAEYWTPDEAKIKKVISAGMTIPGVNSFQEETPVIV